MMKIKQIALLVAGLATSVAATAASVTPADIVAAKTAGTLQQAWISGASAPSKIVYEGWVKGCDAGTSTIFTNQSTSSTAVTPGTLGNYMAYACTRAGAVSVLYHSVDGGSLTAYAPHTVGDKLARVKFPTASVCNTATKTYTDSLNTKNSATIYKSCALAGAALPATGSNTTSNTTNAAGVLADALGPQLPAGGFSDVEAALFPSSIGGGDVSAVGTETDAGILQGFGVAVTKTLYRALQVAQGIYTDVATANTSDSSFLPANAPSLTRGEIAAVLAQGTEVANNASWAPILGSNPGKVKVMRRVNTSGTQSSSNAFFLNSPCATTVGANLTPLSAADSAGNLLVVENAGSGDVRTALITAEGDATATEKYALGVLSVENTPTTTWRFIKIDGVHPEDSGDTSFARKSTAEGKYAFAMEMKTFVANTATGFEADIIPAIVTDLTKPATAAQCAVLPRGLSITPAADDGTCTKGTQVAKVYKGGNNCAVAVKFSN